MNTFREQFPLLQRTINGKPLVYFDNAATTPKPIHVLEEMITHYKEHAGNPNRSTHTLANEAAQLLDETRKKILAFVGADEHDYAVIFTKNATEALNLAAQIVTESGKYTQTITTELEHHANFLPWLRSRQQGKTNLEFIKVDSSGVLHEGDVVTRISRFKRSIVAITAASNVTGQVLSLDEITQAAHKNDSIVVVDASQAFAHCRFNLDKIAVDFLAASAHKAYGPEGVGFLIMRREFLASASPLLVGGGIVDHVSTSTYLLKKDEERLEAGTQNIAGISGFSAALDFIQTVGLGLMLQKEQSLYTYLLSALRNIPGITIIQPENILHRTPIVSFYHESVHPHDIASELDQQGIAVRAGLHCAEPVHMTMGIKGSVRVSLAFYNTTEEIDYFIAALKTCLQKYV